MSKGEYDVQKAEIPGARPPRRDSSYRSFLCAILIFLVLCLLIVLIGNWKSISGKKERKHTNPDTEEYLEFDQKEDTEFVQKSSTEPEFLATKSNYAHENKTSETNTRKPHFHDTTIQSTTTRDPRENKLTTKSKFEKIEKLPTEDDGKDYDYEVNKDSYEDFDTKSEETTSKIDLKIVTKGTEKTTVLDKGVNETDKDALPTDEQFLKKNTSKESFSKTTSPIPNKLGVISKENESTFEKTTTPAPNKLGGVAKEDESNFETTTFVDKLDKKEIYGDYIETTPFAKDKEDGDYLKTTRFTDDFGTNKKDGGNLETITTDSEYFGEEKEETTTIADKFSKQENYGDKIKTTSHVIEFGKEKTDRDQFTNDFAKGGNLETTSPSHFGEEMEETTTYTDEFDKRKKDQDHFADDLDKDNKDGGNLATTSPVHFAEENEETTAITDEFDKLKKDRDHFGDNLGKDRKEVGTLETTTTTSSVHFDEEIEETTTFTDEFDKLKKDDQDHFADDLDKDKDGGNLATTTSPVHFAEENEETTAITDEFDKLKKDRDHFGDNLGKDRKEVGTLETTTTTSSVHFGEEIEETTTFTDEFDKLKKDDQDHFADDLDKDKDGGNLAITTSPVYFAEENEETTAITDEFDKLKKDRDHFGDNLGKHRKEVGNLETTTTSSVHFGEEIEETTTFTDEFDKLKKDRDHFADNSHKDKKDGGNLETTTFAENVAEEKDETTTLADEFDKDNNITDDFGKDKKDGGNLETTTSVKRVGEEKGETITFIDEFNTEKHDGNNLNPTDDKKDGVNLETTTYAEDFDNDNREETTIFVNEFAKEMLDYNSETTESSEITTTGDFTTESFKDIGNVASNQVTRDYLTAESLIQATTQSNQGVLSQESSTSKSSTGYKHGIYFKIEDTTTESTTDYTNTDKYQEIQGYPTRVTNHSFATVYNRKEELVETTTPYLILEKMNQDATTDAIQTLIVQDNGEVAEKNEIDDDFEASTKRAIDRPATKTANSIDFDKSTQTSKQNQGFTVKSVEYFEGETQTSTENAEFTGDTVKDLINRKEEAKSSTETIITGTEALIKQTDKTISSSETTESILNQQLTPKTMQKSKHEQIRENTCESRGCKSVASNILTLLDDNKEACEDFFEFSCGSKNNHLDKPDARIWEALFRQTMLLDNSSEAHLLTFRRFYDSCVNFHYTYSYEDRIKKVKEILKSYGMESFQAAKVCDIDNIFKKLLALNSMYFMEVGVDVLDEKQGRVLQLGPSLESSGEIEPWSALAANQRRCLGEQRQKIYGSANLNLSAIHESYTECLDDHKEFRQLLHDSIKAFGYDKNEGINQHYTIMYLTKLLGIRPNRTEINEAKINKVFTKMTVGELQSVYPQVNWTDIFSIVQKEAVNANQQVRVYFKDYLKNWFDIFSKINEKKWLLINLLITDLYYNFVVHKVNDDVQNHCLKTSATYLTDVASNLFLKNLPDAFVEKQETRVHDVFRVLKSRFHDALQNSSDFSELTGIVDDLRITFSNKRELATDLDLKDKYEYFGTYPSYQEYLLKAKEFRMHNLDVIFGGRLNVFDRQPVTFYQRNKIYVPIGMVADIPLNLPEHVTLARIGIKLAQSMAKHFDPVSIKLMKKNSQLEYSYDTLVFETNNFLSIIEEKFHHFKATVNPILTVNERMSDNTALRLLTDAHVGSGNEKILPWISGGYNKEKIMLIAVAQEFCDGEDALDYMVKLYEDGKLPGAVRVHNMFMNSEFFTTVFGCVPGQGMEADLTKTQFPHIDNSKDNNNFYDA